MKVHKEIHVVLQQFKINNIKFNRQICKKMLIYDVFVLYAKKIGRETDMTSIKNTLPFNNSSAINMLNSEAFDLIDVQINQVSQLKYLEKHGVMPSIDPNFDNLSYQKIRAQVRCDVASQNGNPEDITVAEGLTFFELIHKAAVELQDPGSYAVPSMDGINERYKQLYAIDADTQYPTKIAIEMYQDILSKHRIDEVVQDNINCEPGT